MLPAPAALLLAVLLACSYAGRGVVEAADLRAVQSRGPQPNAAPASAAAAAGKRHDAVAARGGAAARGSGASEEEEEDRPITAEEMEEAMGEPLTPRMRELMRQLEEQMEQVRRENPGAHIQFINMDDFGVESVYKPARCDVKAKTGDIVSVHMLGTATDGGKVFVDTRGAKGDGEPWVVELGAGQLPVPAMDMALQGLCIGESAVVELPAHLAFGEQGSPPNVPPGSGVRVNVDIVAINHLTGDDDEDYDDGDDGDKGEGGGGKGGKAPRDEL